MYRWLLYKGKWKVVLIKDDFYRFFGTMMAFPVMDVPEDLWGPYILEPRYIEHREKKVVAVEVSDVENAEDKEINHELLGERYFCPDFKIDSKSKLDCPVVAIANILGVTYSEAKLKCFHAGWSSSQRLTSGFCEQILIDEGFHVCFRKDLNFGVVKDFQSKGTFLIRIPLHIMPTKNNIVYNCKGYEFEPIQEVYEIRRKSSGS